jgi:hypothetical protein
MKEKKIMTKREMSKINKKINKKINESDLIKGGNIQTGGVEEVSSIIKKLFSENNLSILQTILSVISGFMSKDIVDETMKYISEAFGEKESANKILDQIKGVIEFANKDIIKEIIVGINGMNIKLEGKETLLDKILSVRYNGENFDNMKENIDKIYNNVLFIQSTETKNTQEKIIMERFRGHIICNLDKKLGIMYNILKTMFPSLPELNVTKESGIIFDDQNKIYPLFESTFNNLSPIKKKFFMFPDNKEQKKIIDKYIRMILNMFFNMLAKLDLSKIHLKTPKEIENESAKISENIEKGINTQKIREHPENLALSFKNINPETFKSENKFFALLFSLIKIPKTNVKFAEKGKILDTISKTTIYLEKKTREIIINILTNTVANIDGIIESFSELFLIFISLLYFRHKLILGIKNKETYDQYCANYYDEIKKANLGGKKKIKKNKKKEESDDESEKSDNNKSESESEKENESDSEEEINEDEEKESENEKENEDEENDDEGKENANDNEDEDEENDDEEKESENEKENDDNEGKESENDENILKNNEIVNESFP